MPTDRELLEQGAKQITQINAIVRSQDATIKELTKIIDEQIKINYDNQLLIINQNTEITSHKEYIAILEQNVNTLTNNIKMLERL